MNLAVTFLSKNLEYSDFTEIKFLSDLWVAVFPLLHPAFFYAAVVLRREARKRRNSLFSNFHRALLWRFFWKGLIFWHGSWAVLSVFWDKDGSLEDSQMHTYTGERFLYSPKSIKVSVLTEVPKLLQMPK